MWSMLHMSTKVEPRATPIALVGALRISRKIPPLTADKFKLSLLDGAAQAAGARAWANTSAMGRGSSTRPLLQAGTARAWASAMPAWTSSSAEGC